MAHNVEYILNFATKNADKIDKVAGQSDRLDKKLSAVGSTAKKVGGVIAGVFAIRKIVAYAKEAEAAYTSQSVAITKLGQVMSNTMDATQAQVKQVVALTEAQEKLGVIATDIQQSGAQELATYLTKTSSLEKLIPVMNDMLAQQYGLNASQEQAINIASMMGKVMDGQVGALSRYGYKFDEAQEKILKFGTEAQRAGTLVDVISGSVGGVNKALTATPEGKLKQLANEAGGVKVQFGKVYTSIKAALIPVRKEVLGVFSGMVSWLEQNGQTIASVVGGIVSGIMGVFDFVGGIISRVIDALSPIIEHISIYWASIAKLFTNNSGVMLGIVTTTVDIIVGAIGVLANILAAILKPINLLIQGLADGSPVAVALTVAIGALTAAMTVGYIISKKQLILNKLGVVWLNILILKETLLGKAVALKNKLMLASPWGLAAAGMAGLIALTVKLNSKYSLLIKSQREISKRVASTYAEEKLQLDKLYKQLEKTLPKSAERNRLVDELKQLYPDVVKGLEDELRTTNNLTGAYTKLADEARRSSYERAKAAILDEKSKQLTELISQGGQPRTWLEKLWESDTFYNIRHAEKVADLRKEIEQLENMNIIAGVVLDTNKLNEQVGKLAATFPMFGAVWAGKGLIPVAAVAGGGKPEVSGGGGNGGGAAVGEIESAITGGAKSTNININIGKMVETMTFSSNSMQQNVHDMEAQVLDAMLRVVNMSQAAAR